MNQSRGAIPIISHQCVDGTLLEAVYDPAARSTALAVGYSDGTTTIMPEFDLAAGETLVPYSPQNNLIASGCVLLPSAIGDFGEKGELLEEVRTFIHRYVDLSPAFEEIAAHYVLLTWVYDAFNELPYLRLRGDWGTGKTRALITIGSICYKPFFASGASTVSPLFHVLDAFRGTLVLDEADFRFSDATAELTKILNNGNVAGLPVLRTMTNRHRELNPQAFNVFGPKLVGMREGFADRALESRFLTEETGGRTLRADISIHLPNELKAEALALRNRLLAWRFNSVRQAGPKPDRLVPNVAPRLNQTALALLSVIDEPVTRAMVARELAKEDARGCDERASSTEAAVLAAICLETGNFPLSSIPLSRVAEQFSRNISGNPQASISSKSVGYIVRNKLRLATRKSHGVSVIPETELAKLPALAARYGIVADQQTPAE